MNFLKAGQNNYHTITLQDESNSYNCTVNHQEFIAIENGDYELANKIMQKEIERQHRLLAFKFLKESSKDLEHGESQYQNKGNCSKKLFFQKPSLADRAVPKLGSTNEPQTCQQDLQDAEYLDFINEANFEDVSYSQSGNVTENTDVGSETSNSTMVTPSKKMWTDTNIRALIELYKQHEKEFETSIKKLVWEKIAQILSAQTGTNINWSQCDTKFKGLKDYYKTVKKHNDISGNNFRFWIYYDLMDALLSKKPEITAAFTCSNVRGLTDANKQSVNEIKITNPESDTERESEASASSAFESLNVKKRKKEENAVERRHKDKMSRQDKYLDLFERFVVCLKTKKNKTITYILE